MDYASRGRGEGNVLINSTDGRVVRADNEKEGSAAAEERDSDAFFSIGDFVDACHPDLGCFFEARIQRITCYHSAFSSSSSSQIHEEIEQEEGRRGRRSPLRPSAASVRQETASDPVRGSEQESRRTVLYYVKFLRSCLAEVIPVERKQIRLQSSVRIGFQEVHAGALVMANFNLSAGDDGPGFWYDCLITNKDLQERKLFATVFIGGYTSSPSIRAATSVHEVQTIAGRAEGEADGVTEQQEEHGEDEEEEGNRAAACIPDQRIRFVDELYLIEKSTQRRDRSPRSMRILAQGVPELRESISLCPLSRPLLRDRYWPGNTCYCCCCPFPVDQIFPITCHVTSHFRLPPDLCYLSSFFPLQRLS